MRAISAVKWTDISIEHISRHAVKPEEVEEVCFNEYESPFIRTGRDKLHYIFGKTLSGRFLFVVTRFIRNGEIRVITARDMMNGKRTISREEANNMTKNSHKIPAFKTDGEAAKFWERHSFEDYHRDTLEAEIRFIKRPKKTVAIRLDPEDIKSVEAIARRKGLSYTSLLRMWIKENLSKEEKNAA